MKSLFFGLLGSLAFSSSSLAAVLTTQSMKNAVNQHSLNNKGSAREGLETLDGVSLAEIPGAVFNAENPEGRAAAPEGARALAAAGWTAYADSEQPGNEARKAIDNDPNTYWHTTYGANPAPLPHSITIDMQQVQLINSLSYQPRQDGKPNGNIGGHTITTSKDCKVFTPPFVLGTWRDDQTTKVSVFEAHNARCVRLTALTEAGPKPGRGPWSSAAEIQIYTTNNPAPAYGGIGGGKWSPTIDFPIVPVSAALEFKTGNILTWSAYNAAQFGGSDGVTTLTARFYPASQTVEQRGITNTKHDMFCPGLSIDAAGRVFVTGGNTSPRTSIFLNNEWSSGPNTQIARGYASQTTMSDGRTFLIGGSWSGGQGNKNGEVYDPATNLWKKLPKCPVAPMLTKDPADAANDETYRSDNHAWLFAWKAGWVFQAGPSRAMNWYRPGPGDGYQAPAGNRGNDGDAMCGNAVMYDAVAGKILAVGGSVAYQDRDSTANAHIITLGAEGQNPGVQTINPMYYQRIFANAVVLPNGDVLIVGGQVYGKPFSDATSQYTPELWQASTTRFIKLPPIAVPRNYHSVAILQPDGTVFQGGGGLCGDCATNHFNAQVYSPGYLFNADSSRAARPVINSATAELFAGQVITANTNGGIASWSLIRISSTTHTVNTDQRRIPLKAQANGNTYTMTVPADRGISLPGFYMLFAMNAQGTPSLSKFVKVK